MEGKGKEKYRRNGEEEDRRDCRVRVPHNPVVLIINKSAMLRYTTSLDFRPAHSPQGTTLMLSIDTLTCCFCCLIDPL